jgi:fatty-acid desaturase
MHASKALFISQLFAHGGLLYLVFTGTIFQWLVCLTVYFLTGCFGMSMTYHRLLSHRSWKAPGWFQKLGILLGSIGLTGSALAWTAIHRQHHSSPDQAKDPHSPHVQPWWRVQFLSMYYKPNLRFVRDLLKDPFVVFAHRNYFLVQFIYVTLLILIEPQSIIYAYLAPAAILWHGGSLINTVGHKWGYRNFKVKDQSVNNPVLGIMMWGEGWHNNHHAKPFKSSFSHHPWELDISALFIKSIMAVNKWSLKTLNPKTQLK